MTRRRLLAAAAVAVAVTLLAGPAFAGRTLVHDLPLPPGSRSLEPDRFESSRSFRKTVEFYQRELRRRGLPHEAVPIYRYRGTVVARFLSQDPGSKWRALHIYRSEGRTRIFIVRATDA